MVESEKKFADSYKVILIFISIRLLKIFPCSQAAQLSMNNVMQNEGEYVMQISALTSSLNVSKNISADLYLLSHLTASSLH